MTSRPAPTEPTGPEFERMQPRLIKGLQADYIQVAWPGNNSSGLKVFGKNVLVRMDECSQSSAGGVLLGAEIVDRMTEASESGCIYAVGPAAFRLFDDGHRWEGDKPEVGQRVYVGKYSGVKAIGRDGAFYRIMDEGCILAATDDAEGEPV